MKNKKHDRDHGNNSKRVKQRVARAWGFRRHVPELLQLSATECGAVCLAMILNYYGFKVSVSEVHERCGIGRDGVTVLTIAKAARTYGLRVRAVSVPENNLHLLQCPCIIHWEFNHFMVLEQWSPQRISVVDPALGRRSLTSQEFDVGFTGVVLLLEPGSDFGTQGKPAASRFSMRTYATIALRGRNITILAQILIASLLLQFVGLAMPLLTEIIIGQVIPYSFRDLIPWLGIGVGIVVLAQFVLTLLRSFLLVYLQAHVDSQMMLNFVEHLLALPYRFFQQRSTGDLLTRLSSNTVIRDTITAQLISLILDGSFTFVYLIIMLGLSPLFGILALFIGLLQVALLLGSARPMHQLMQSELAVQGKAQGSATEIIAGIETVKSMGAEQQAFEYWSNFFFENTNISIRRNNLSNLINGMLSAFNILAPMLLLWTGSLLVLNGTLSLSVMLALNALASTFFSPLSSLAGSGQKLQMMRAHLDRIGDVLQTEPEQDSVAVQMLPKLNGDIEVRDVSFQYTPESPPVLRNINFSVRSGQKVAIVGHTGSGKSTLGKLLLGLYEPTSGEIYYDGLPLRSFQYLELRNQFGVVLQDGFIFNQSVRRNIAFKTPELSMEQIITAAKLAAIHDDIVRMPMQYETPVGEGGTAISGGQRQRLALARALVSSPSILLLDEATSHLDVVTEQIVDQNLDALKCTRIIIAHRLSTIRNADLIVVLKYGEVVETGTHEHLLEQGGHYAQLVQSQMFENNHSLFA